MFFWLSAWWASRLPWWPPAECSNVSMSCEYWYLQNVFLFLYHCCILSEIKLTTTTMKDRMDLYHRAVNQYCCVMFCAAVIDYWWLIKLQSLYILRNIDMMFMFHSRGCINSSCGFITVVAEWCIPMVSTLIARFMGPKWGPSGADRTQLGLCWPHELCYLDKLSTYNEINLVCCVCW